MCALLFRFGVRHESAAGVFGEAGLRGSYSLYLLACVVCAACGVAGQQPGAEPDDTVGGASVVGAGGDAHAGAAAAPPGSAGGEGGASGGGSADAGSSAGEGLAGSEAEPEPSFVTGLEPTEPYPDNVYPEENPFTPEKALLGKILFWEEQLSSNDTHACGTCHQPRAGGSDPRAAVEAPLGAGSNGIFGDADDAHGSEGVVRCDSSGTPKPDPIYGLDVQVTTRKAPSALDAMFFDELFWDGRAGTSFVDPVTGAVAIQVGGTLESQAAGPPLNSIEMSCEGYGWTAIASKLTNATPLKLATLIPKAMSDAVAQHPSYPALFEWVYGTAEVSAQRILFSIATYERQLRSDQTPWDRFNAGDADALTPDQRAGLALFNVKARCSTCHIPPLFADNAFHNIGARAPTLDPGRSIITQDAADLGKMKTPSLRNVGLRAAGGLLHFGTGSGATLRSVVAVYREGGIDQANIDQKILALNLPDFELEQLLDFLQNGLNDPRALAELPPFDRPRLGSEL